MDEQTIRDMGFVPMNISEPGTVEYYKDALFNIYLIGKDYDGYHTDDIEKMRKLLDSLVKIADIALSGGTLFWAPIKKEEDR